MISVYLVGLLAVGITATRSSLGPWWQAVLTRPGALDVLAFTTTVLPVWLCSASLEARPRGATPGKRRCGLRVEPVSGDRTTWRRTLIRNGLKLLPWQLAHLAVVRMVPGGAGDPPETWLATAALVACWALVAGHLLGLTARCGCRPLHDRIAGTVVVQARAEERPNPRRGHAETRGSGPA